MKIRTYVTMFLLLASSVLIGCGNPTETTSKEQKPQEEHLGNKKKEWAIVIHGGTEGDTREEEDEEAIRRHEEGLEEALSIGRDILSNGGTSSDAVEAVIRYLEDNQEFNAGKGAVKTEEGTYELDAAIMDGRDFNVGSVTGVTTVKNPISLARHVMEESSHVFFWGSGAEQFADEMEVERVENTYFSKNPISTHAALQSSEKEVFSLGTVGCVAIDYDGNIVAGTSTGGRSGKAHGRIGDSPVIGAGTYANNTTCGISATGAGEEFIKLSVSHDISALMEYKELSLQEAADLVVQRKLKKGTGGVIGLDYLGNIVASYNTEGLYRASADSEGLYEVKIWE